MRRSTFCGVCGLSQIQALEEREEASQLHAKDNRSSVWEVASLPFWLVGDWEAPAGNFGSELYVGMDV